MNYIHMYMHPFFNKHGNDLSLHFLNFCAYELLWFLKIRRTIFLIIGLLVLYCSTRKEY